MAASPLRRAIAAIATVAAAATLALAAGPAGADQTVRHDGPDGARRISLVGDSTLTGVRWYDDYGALRQYDFVFSAESCRRTVERSCISREGYRSATVVEAMRQLDGELGELLVVMSGYNDPDWSIAAAIEAVLGEARRQGVPAVMWLTLRTNGVDYSDPQEQTSTDTFRQYNEQLIEAAAASDGYLQIADWGTYSTGSSAWFEYDGVHLTPRGVDALTSFIADRAGRVLAGEQISPAAAPWTVLVPGAEGDVVADVQTALLAAGIDVPGGADGVYGGDTMAAVAEYQRAHPDLQVTGAVDAATARSLGVFGAEVPVPTTVPAPEAATEPLGGDGRPVGLPAEVPISAPAAAAPDVGGGNSTTWMLAAAGAVLTALIVLVVARRRYVVARRARRWARVHPATSPLRSVADLRREGAVPFPGHAGEAAAAVEPARR